VRVLGYPTEEWLETNEEDAIEESEQVTENDESQVF
jgi:hypothetical protein